MRRWLAALILAAAGAGGAAAHFTDPLLEPVSGGAATADQRSRTAFSRNVPGLDAEPLAAFAFGNRVFNTAWIEAPASAAMFDGLGPFFSQRSCSGCHVRDGRGRPPERPDDASRSMIVKLASPAAGGGWGPDPRYGAQLSERAVQGLVPEARLEARWAEFEETLAGGERVSMRRPLFAIRDPGYGTLDTATRYSVRIAPAVFGVGLLEAVPDSLLAAFADPDDRDGDGISGRVHWVRHADGARRAGRYGWKAAQATVAGQVGAALIGDMGLTTPAHPMPEVTGAQHDALERPNGGEPELDGRRLATLLDYCRLLAVPARGDLDDAVRRGARAFRAAGCVSCHAVGLVTGDDPVAALSRQTIYPFSDLLLHDLGDGLDDGMPDGDAASAEWRTAPLWGLGLALRVNGYRFLLHDGRARTFEEAILWHGGEAARSRQAFRVMPAHTRSDLLRFLESL